MVPRYSRPEMAAIWSPENRYRIWFEIEALAAEGMARVGAIPEEAARTIREKGAPKLAAINAADIERIDAIERETRHDVIAFLTWLAEAVGPDSRFVHQGMTSSDVLDTCLSVQLTQAADLLLADIDAVLAALKTRAIEHKYTLTIGRSHGIHAEPTTFGLKLAGHYAEFARGRERLVAARAEVAVAAVSGAVGTFAHLDPSVEEYVAAKLGLRPEPVSTQVIPRDRHAAFFCTLAVIASGIERLATEVRHLQRSEVREAEEFFHPGQKGSSAMPHKRNPVLSENLCGLARIVRSAVVPALENVTLVARARHQPLLGRAGHRAGRDGDAGFRADAAGGDDGEAGGASGADAGKFGELGRGGALRRGAAGADQGGDLAGGCLPDRAEQRDGDVDFVGDAGREDVPAEFGRRSGRGGSGQAGGAGCGDGPGAASAGGGPDF